MRNILVQDWEVNGIADWENTGWWPEYWKFTRCYYSDKLHKRWLAILDECFEGKYKEERGSIGG